MSHVHTYPHLANPTARPGLVLVAWLPFADAQHYIQWRLVPSNALKAPHAQARIVLWASAVLTATRVLAYLVHGGDLLAVVEESVAEGVLCSAAALFPGDELEALDHICHHLMLQAAVLSLCVLPAHNVAGCWALPSCRQKSLVTTW